MVHRRAKGVLILLFVLILIAGIVSVVSERADTEPEYDPPPGTLAETPTTDGDDTPNGTDTPTDEPEDDPPVGNNTTDKEEPEDISSPSDDDSDDDGDSYNHPESDAEITITGNSTAK